MEKIRTEMFFWDGDEKRFSQEASTLRWSPVRPGRPDEFILVSAQTEAEVLVRLVDTDVDAFENEVIYWTYRPVDPKYTFRVEVWND